MAPRTLLLVPLGLVLLQPEARANGFQTSAGGLGLTAPRAAAHLSGFVRSFVLTNRQGRRQTVPLAAPRSLADGLPIPAGDWADLTLTFAGPVHLVKPDGDVLLPGLDTLTVPLERPDADSARIVYIDLSLPDALRSAADLVAAVRDGALAVDGP